MVLAKACIQQPQLVTHVAEKHTELQAELVDSCHVSSVCALQRVSVLHTFRIKP